MGHPERGARLAEYVGWSLHLRVIFAMASSLFSLTSTFISSSNLCAVHGVEPVYHDSDGLYDFLAHVVMVVLVHSTGDFANLFHEDDIPLRI